MDNFSAQGSNLQENKPLVYSEKDPAIFFAKIRNFFKRKSVIVILVSLIILVVGLFILNYGSSIYKNFQSFLENKKNADIYQKEAQRRINLENFRIGDTQAFGFFGKTNKIDGKNIVLETKKGLKTIQTKEDTSYFKLLLILEEKTGTEDLDNPLVKADFSKIVKGDLLYIIGTESGKNVLAEQIWIYEIPSN